VDNQANESVRAPDEKAVIMIDCHLKIIVEDRFENYDCPGIQIDFLRRMM
jgi:hypothetical protein